MGSVTGRDATGRRSIVRRASSRHDERDEDPREHRQRDDGHTGHQPGRPIPELDLTHARRNPDAEDDIASQIAGRPVDRHRPSGPIDNVGPDDGRSITIGAEPQSAIVDIIGHDIGTAGIGDGGNRPMHDRQAIGDAERAVITGPDDTDAFPAASTPSVAVSPRRRSGRSPTPVRRANLLDRHDHRRVSDHHGIPEDEAARNGDVDLDRCGERCLEVKFDGTESGGEVDRRRTPRRRGRPGRSQR